MGLERDVLAGAAERGLRLQPGVTHRWLTVRGHLDPFVQREAPAEALEALDDVHDVLGGDRRALARRRSGSLRTDLVVCSTGQIVEVDELEHFTSARMTSLAAYPMRRFGFSIDLYRDLIETWKARANAVFTQRWSPDFDFVGGRRAQRAYHDALRDWLAPAFTGLPIVRLAVPDGDVDAALDQLMLALA